jgi:hypothetical protein
MPYDAPPDLLDRDLVFDFFWKFSVFECALKREGFLQVDRNDGAQPNWNEFGKRISGRSGEVRADGFQDALRALVEASPQRQIVLGGRLAWQPVERRIEESEEEFALRLVKIVRNNLFHGGKYPDGPVKEIARDRHVLLTALSVLKGCSELHPGIFSQVESAT